MRDLIREYGKGTILYGILLGSAQLVNRQLLKQESVSQSFDKLQNSMTEALTNTGWSAAWLKMAFLLTGLLLLWLAGQLVKAYVKHNATVKWLAAHPSGNEPDSDIKPWNFLMVYLVLLALALPGTGLLFYVVGPLDSLYRGSVGIIQNHGGDALANLAPALQITAKLITGLLGVIIFMLLFGLAASRKHGPTLRRVEVNGYAWLTEKLSWKNWVIGRKVRLLPFLGKAGVHLPDWATNTDENERICVAVTAFNYPTRSALEHTYISYKTDIEPRGISEGQVDSKRVFIRYLLTVDGQSKTLVRRAYMEESPRRTRSKSTRAFGDSYAHDEKCLMCLRFNIKRGDDGDIDIEEEMDDDLEDSVGGLDANTFERWDKMGLRRLLDWGPGYKLIFRSRSYDVDMDFFGSWVFTASIALRRKFYVRNADNRIVAKLVERNILKKAWPILDNDWRIDIYDPELAGDGGFGYVLSLVTQYLRKAHFYDIHACIRTVGREESSETS